MSATDWLIKECINYHQCGVKIRMHITKQVPPLCKWCRMKQEEEEQRAVQSLQRPTGR